ncbi:MAG: hypothetical protein AABZ30_10315 [Myxococcota bacterium]
MAAGEVQTPRRRPRLAWPGRFTLTFLPYLALLIVLAAKLVLDHPLVYYAAGFLVLAFGTWRGLERVRRDQRARTPGAPDGAALLLGGVGLWRDLGLAWIDGDGLRFATHRAELLLTRRDVTRVRWRPLLRELEIDAVDRTGGRGGVRRFRFGGLATTFTELPRFHRAVQAWLAGARAR